MYNYNILQHITYIILQHITYIIYQGRQVVRLRELGWHVQVRLLLYI